MDILSMLNNLDKDTLEKGIRQATQFLSTPEGQSAAKMLSEGKMPTGEAIPDNLKDAAQIIKDNKQAQNMLGELMKKSVNKAR